MASSLDGRQAVVADLRRMGTLPKPAQSPQERDLWESSESGPQFDGRFTPEQAGPNPGQRLILGFVGGLAFGTIAVAIENDEVVAGSGYGLGTVIGISLANRHFDGFRPLPAVVGVALGAIPLVVGLNMDGDITPGLVAVTSMLTMPLFGALAYEF